MKKISKAEFIRRVTQNKTIFVGVTRIMSDEWLDEAIKQTANCSIPARYAAERGMMIAFSESKSDLKLRLDCSYLSLTNSPEGNCVVTCYEYGDMLIVKDHFQEGFNGEPFIKYMVYRVVS